MRKFPYVLLALVILGLTVIGCGESTPAPAPTQTPAAPTTPTPAPSAPTPAPATPSSPAPSAPTPAPTPEQPAVPASDKYGGTLKLLWDQGPGAYLGHNPELHAPQVMVMFSQ